MCVPDAFSEKPVAGCQQAILRPNTHTQAVPLVYKLPVLFLTPPAGRQCRQLLLTSSPKNFDTNPTRRGENVGVKLACEASSKSVPAEADARDISGEVPVKASFEMPVGPSAPFFEGPTEARAAFTKLA